MPYRKGNYRHKRYQDPDLFDKDTFRTVPISHTDSKLKNKYPNALAVVGKKKKTKRLTRRGNKPWVIQKIMIPK